MSHSPGEQPVSRLEGRCARTSVRILQGYAKVATSGRSARLKAGRRASTRPGRRTNRLLSVKSLDGGDANQRVRGSIPCVRQLYPRLSWNSQRVTSSQAHLFIIDNEIEHPFKQDKHLFMVQPVSSALGACGST